MRSKQKLAVFLIIGGRSIEHESSLISARYVLPSLERSGYQARVCGISTQGSWVQEQICRRALRENWLELKVADPNNYAAECVSKIMAQPMPKIVFPVMHGRQGDDGAINAFFNLLPVPCVGNSFETYNICFNKLNLKRFCASHGIPYVPYSFVDKKEWSVRGVATLKNVAFGRPLFVKPVTGGSSLGISIIQRKSSVRNALEKAFKISDAAIIEPQVPEIREIEILISGAGHGKIEYVGEVISQNKYQDYEAKLREQRLLIAPADLPRKLTGELSQFAQGVYLKLHLTSYARVDIFLQKSGKYYLAEVTPVPGFNKTYRHFESMGKPWLFDEFLRGLMQNCLKSYKP